MERTATSTGVAAARAIYDGCGVLDASIAGSCERANVQRAIDLAQRVSPKGEQDPLDIRAAPQVSRIAHHTSTSTFATATTASPPPARCTRTTGVRTPSRE